MAKKFYTNEEVTQKSESLPEEIQNLLYSFEMTSIITKVGEKNGLHIDQMDRLNTETGYVMMGLTQTQDFPQIIAEDLEIDITKAQAVAKDIDEMLFTKIREAMKKAQMPAAPIINASSSTSKPPLSSVLPTSTPTAPPATPAPASAPNPTPAPVAPTANVPATPAPTSVEIPPKLEAVEKKVDVKPSDIMLSEPTVAKTPEVAIKISTDAPASPKATQGTAPKPQDYKADPYREPTT